MATKKKLQELLKDRETPKREAVTPVSLYTKPNTLDDKTTGTQVVKYTTHLKKETIKAIKRYAVEAELKDYEIVQEAIDRYLKGKGL